MPKYIFFYKGKAVRSSDHEYAYGVTNVEGTTVLSCHATERAAKSARTREINEAKQVLGNYERALKARQAGRTYYREEAGRIRWQQKLRDSDTVPELMERIERTSRRIDNLEKRQVVELERRVNR